jgi:hypothetical protein
VAVFQLTSLPYVCLSFQSVLILIRARARLFTDSKVAPSLQTLGHFEQVTGIEPALFQIGNLAHHHLCVTCLWYTILLDRITKIYFGLNMNISTHIKAELYLWELMESNHPNLRYFVYSEARYPYGINSHFIAQVERFELPSKVLETLILSH